MFTTLMLVAVLGAAPAEAPKLVKVQCPECLGKGGRKVTPTAEHPPDKEPCPRCKERGFVTVPETEGKVILLRKLIKRATQDEAQFRQWARLAPLEKDRLNLERQADEEKAKITEAEAALKKLEPPPVTEQISAAEAKVKRLEAELTAAKADLDALKAKTPEGK